MKLSQSKTDPGFPLKVVIICGFAVAFDAYELVAYGATMPALIEEFGMSTTVAGLVGSIVLLGTLLGSILTGTLAALVDRTYVFIGTIIWSSAFTIACSLATTTTQFALCRFLAGLAIGGLIPLAATITHSASSDRHRTVTYVIMQSGFPLGGMMAPLATMTLMPAFSWHAVYWMAALPLFTVLPAAWLWLPRTGRDERSQLIDSAGKRSAKTIVTTLFSPAYRRTTLTLWFIIVGSMLVVYGANTWIPQLMKSREDILVTGLWFLLIFNAGAIIGSLAAAWLVDRLSMKPVVVTSFLIGAFSILIFSLSSNNTILIVAAALAGYGAVGTQTLLNSWATSSYPGWLKSLGAGWALGVGRLGGIAGPYLVGIIIAQTGSSSAALWMFSIVALLAGICALAVPPLPTDRPAKYTSLQQVD